MSAHAKTSLLGVLLLAAACSGEVAPIPAGALVTCASDADCPSGSFCSQALGGRCVPTGGGDQDPPGVVAGSASVSPGAARAGTVVTVTFEADEDLAADPEVRFAGAAAPLGVPSHVGRVYTVEFPARTSDGEGTRTVVARMVDLFGNVADNVPIGNVVLDFTPPSAATPTFSPAFARVGSAVGTAITFTEPLGAAPTLSIEGGPSLSAAAGPGANEWTFARTLDGTEPQGPASFLLQAQDPAGNPLSLRYAAAVAIDFRAPAVAASSVGTPAVRAGGTLVAGLQTDEPLGAPPAVSLVPAGGGTGAPVVVSALDASTFALSYDVPLGAADGDFVLRVVSGADRAGNPLPAADLGAVRFDSTAPGVSGLAPDHANRLYRAGQPVQVSFTLSETVPSAPVVRLETLPSPIPMPCVAGAAPRSYVCASPALGGTELPQSVVNVSVTATDAAGNVATAGTGVVLDFTPPLVLAAGPGRAAFPAGGQIAYTVSVSEPLAAAPTLAVSLGGTPVPGFFGAPASASATTFAWSRAVPAGADGSYGVSVSITDEAGNVAAPSTGAGFSVDTAFPAVVGGFTVSPSKSAYRAGDRPALTFTVSEDIPVPVARLNTATPVDATCAVAGTRIFTCTLSRALAATDLPEGATAFLVTLSDAAGNVGYGSRSLTLDYTPAALASAPATRYLGSATTGGVTVSAAGNGSSWEIAILSAEPLSAAPALTAVAPAGGFSRSLTLQSATGGTSFVYLFTTGGISYPAATWSVRWDPIDLAGNRWPAASLPQIATVDVDGVAPPAPAPGTAASPQILWTRQPWGSDLSELPLFQLGASAAALGSDASVLVAWDGSGAQAREVGRGDVGAGGATFSLASDPADLWVSTFDRAGNESPRTRVVDVAWTATAAAKVPGSTFENPHRLETRTLSSRALVQTDAVEVAGSAVGVRSDGLVVQTTGRAVYKPVSVANGPSPRRHYAMAAGAGRGVVVLYGGMLSGGTRPGDTWEWDGSGWKLVTPVDPEGDGNPPTWDGAPMAYDPVRGGVLLASTNLWLWNGRSWRNLDASIFRPGLVQSSSMAWDVSRGVLVLFGGGYGNATWEWDGQAWRDATPALPADSPPARSYHRVAWDPVRQRVLLFGGFTLGSVYLNDLWTWDGTRWTTLASAGAMPGRMDFAMAWDVSRSEMVVQGGVVSGPTWDGKTYVLRTVAGTPTWVDVTPAAGPTAFAEHQAVYDALLGRVLLFGDWSGAQLLAWNGTARTWSLLAPGDPEGDGNPIHYQYTSRDDIAFVPSRGRTVYHESNLRETWEWDRASWARRSSGAGPPARTSATIGRYGSNVILFGGSIFGSSVGDTWSWNGTAWTLALAQTPATRSPLQHYETYRENAGMVNDSAGRLYRFGGADYYSGGIRCYTDLWEWTGASWVKRGGEAWADPEGDGSPTGGNSTADSCYTRGRLAWDPVRGSMLFYDWFDIWEWRPSTNSWVRHAMSSLPGFSIQAMFWDTSLGAAVVLDDERAWVVDLGAKVYVPLDVANPYGLVPPSFGVWAFDTGIGKAVGLELVPWTFESASAGGPAHLFTVDYSRANGPDPSVCVNRAACPIQRIDVRWAGGGTAPGLNGSTLQAWNGEWYAAATNSSTAASPSLMTWTWTAASPFPASSLFHGAARELTLALVPNGVTTSAGAARVGTDGLSVEIRYRRP